MTVYRLPEKIRLLIEQYTGNNNFGPNRIEFARDGNGDYIVGPEVLNDPRYTFQKVSKGETVENLRSKLDTEISKEQVESPPELNIAELIKQYGELIEYIPVPDILENEIKKI